MKRRRRKLYAEYKEELKDNVVFMFAGNLGKAQGLDNYLEQGCFVAHLRGCVSYARVR